MFYKHKFIDGLKPYIFTTQKTLFLTLASDYKSIFGILNIKNEFNNAERILHGILDIHAFFTNSKPSYLCYFTDNITYYHQILYVLRIIIIYFIRGLLFFIYHGHQFIKNKHSYSLYYNAIHLTKYLFTKITYTYLKHFMV